MLLFTSFEKEVSLDVALESATANMTMKLAIIMTMVMVKMIMIILMMTDVTVKSMVIFIIHVYFSDVGDLGVVGTNNGKVTLQHPETFLTLFGPYSIFGRSVMVSLMIYFK